MILWQLPASSRRRGLNVENSEDYPSFLTICPMRMAQVRHEVKEGGERGGGHHDEY